MRYTETNSDQRCGLSRTDERFTVSINRVDEDGEYLNDPAGTAGYPPDVSSSGRTLGRRLVERELLNDHFAVFNVLLHVVLPNLRIQFVERNVQLHEQIPTERSWFG